MTDVLVATVSLSTPLILAAMGALISDRSGVFAIGMEGYMLIGAFTAVLGSKVGGPWIGLAFGIAGGLGSALLYALLVIGLRADQVISGIAIGILALGATTYGNSLMVGGDSASSYAQKVDGLPNLRIPGLASLPVVGAALFDQPITFYIAVAVVAAISLFLSYTRHGLALRSTGENPFASEVRGISVMKVRYSAVAVSGVLGGLGGTALSLGVLNTFTDNVTAGRGFIALAAVFFGGWRPLVVVGACVLFGAGDAAKSYFNALGFQVAPQLVAMMPYLITVIVLAAFVRRGAYPAALGQPFVREKR